MDFLEEKQQENKINNFDQVAKYINKAKNRLEQAYDWSMSRLEKQK